MYRCGILINRLLTDIKEKDSIKPGAYIRQKRFDKTRGLYPSGNHDNFPPSTIRKFWPIMHPFCLYFCLSCTLSILLSFPFLLFSVKFSLFSHSSSSFPPNYFGKYCPPPLVSLFPNIRIHLSEKPLQKAAMIKTIARENKINWIVSRESSWYLQYCTYLLGLRM